METEQKNLQEIIKFRLEKLEKIKDSGINPYAYNFNKKDAIESLTQKGESGVGIDCIMDESFQDMDMLY